MMNYRTHRLLAAMCMSMMILALRSKGTADTPEAKPFFTNSIGMKMVFIPEGSFFMGSDETFLGIKGLYDPAHPVEISAFYMAAFEVTKGDFRVFLKETGSTNTFDELGPIKDPEGPL